MWLDHLGNRLNSGSIFDYVTRGFLSIVSSVVNDPNEDIIKHLGSTAICRDLALKADKWYRDQNDEWDCGVACCWMALSWSGFNNEDADVVYRHKISQRGAPLWTIDLFLFLHEQHIRVTMYTLSLGIQPHHMNYAWYAKHLDKEADPEGYVAGQFEVAQTNQMNLINVRHT